jgi:acetyl esterase/lipase
VADWLRSIEGSLNWYHPTHPTASSSSHDHPHAMTIRTAGLHGPIRRLGLIRLIALYALCAPVAANAQRPSSPQLISPADLMAVAWHEPDAKIGYGDDPLQFGYLRLPVGDGPHPVVAFVHGGCYLSQFDIRHAGLAEQALADAGYAVWSIEYRRVGDDGGGWPNTFLDVAAGVDHLRELSDQYGLDLDRVYSVGHSAGANMALWVAARPEVSPSSDVHTENPLPIAGVLALAPAATLAAFHEANVCGGVIDGLMGGSPEQVPERYAAVSPMRIMPRVPQRLVVGAFDSSWGPSGRVYFEMASNMPGIEVTLVEAPESGHFEMIAPMTSTWAIVLSELEALTARE